MKLAPNETADALRFALRLTEVKRWGLVATAREQSVAEHSYRVLLIATACYDYMENGTPHNSYDRIAISSFAIVHDILEVLSGDLDSHFKRALKASYPHAYDDVLANMAGNRDDAAELRHTVMAEERAAKGSVVEVIVKVADLLEAVLFLRAYGTNREHAAHVCNDIMMRLYDYIEAQKKVAHAGASIDWPRVSRFCDLVLAQGHVDAPTVDEKSHPVTGRITGACCVTGVGGICLLPLGHGGGHNFT